MKELFGNLFGGPTTAQSAPTVKHKHDDLYDAIAQNYRGSMHKSIAASQNSTALGHMNAVAQQNSVLRPAPEPKDVPALAISLDAAYDLWAAKYGYEWVNINIERTMPTAGIFKPVWTDPLGTYTVTIDTTPPEPEFDWYTVARRLVHVRALENEGGYYRLVPREWCK